MAKKLTKEQIAAYIKSNGTCCPYCGSKKIGASQAENPNADVDTLQCWACDAEWKNIYKLVGVEEVWIPN